MVGHIVKEMEQELGTDREAALADMRYQFIDKLCSGTVVKTGNPGSTAAAFRSISF